MTLIHNLICLFRLNPKKHSFRNQCRCHVTALYLNILRPKQTGRHFAEYIFQMHFREWKSPSYDSKFTAGCLKCPVDNMSQLVHKMAWHRISNMPLPHSMIWWPISLTHIYRPQCVNETITWDTLIIETKSCIHWPYDVKYLMRTLKTWYKQDYQLI